ncbi:MAG: hydantoinase/oxoprolinase family protein [Clostridiales bacterium]
MSKIRVGIDVGGTFTHAVAIDHDTMELVGKVKVHTTHSAPEGVAKGIIDSIGILLSDGGVNPEDVIFIAHSTTQATNALLEGDVSKVGVFGMGAGIEGLKAKQDAAIADIELAPGKYIPVCHTFLDSAKLSPEGIRQGVETLKSQGAEVIVAAEAYSVDNPENEKLILAAAKEEGLAGTGSHEISQLYGLKTRATTAVINSSILPRMMATANTTESSVQASGIQAPLMIMRGDGGAMTINDMRQRPILTMLSGPAAGVAGALMYEQVSYGVFLEVGGTSTDMSAIKDGNVMVEYALVGGHRTYLRSLDTRTLGIAGGSMIAVKDKKIVDVGPRSAHIAGLPYTAFAAAELAEPSVHFVSPKPGDPEYVALTAKDGKQYALTLTCAANLMGIAKEGDSAFGDAARAREGFQALGRYLGVSPEEAATQVLDIAAKKIIPTVNALITKYKLDPEGLTLVGGGGGAAAIVPYVAQKLNMACKMAVNADVISSIGVALAMVRDMVEKSVINPTSEDILRIRKEAETRVIQMGADPASVEVHIEVEARKNVLRAIALGALAMRKKDHAHKLSPEEQQNIAAEHLHVSPEAVNLLGATDMLSAFGARMEKKKLFGLIKTVHHPLRVTDGDGVVRFSHPDAKTSVERHGDLLQRLPQLIAGSYKYGDGGQSFPDVFLLIGGKIINFAGMADVGQILALAEVETAGYDEEEKVVVITGMKDV